MEIERKDSFAAEDGHIESILIGVDQVKISFQTWDLKKLVLIFDNVEKVISSHSVYEGIGEFQISSTENGFKKYIFYSVCYEKNEEETEILSIEAEKMEIFQVGTGAEINAAIFDVGYEYVGNQTVKEKLMVDGKILTNFFWTNCINAQMVINIRYNDCSVARYMIRFCYGNNRVTARC